MKNLFAFAVILSVFIACATDAKDGWKPLNLLEYGVPITILAPDTPDVKVSDLLVQKDITLKKGDDYYIQIYASDATTTDVSTVVNQQKALLKENPYFQRFVTDEPDGFVYETQVDSSNINYGFRHIRLQGDKEYIFQTGLIGKFTEEEVRKMYDSVRPETK